MGDRDNLYSVIDLKALRCFWAAGRFGSLTRAGIELGISESAVSQRVRALERYLGSKLYETRGGRIRLTPAGDRVLEMAVGLFERLEDFEAGLSTQEVTGEITISAQDPEQLYLLPDVVAHYRRDYPQVGLRLLSRSVAQTVELVRQNEADLGIIPKRPLPDDLVFHDWLTFPSFLLLPPGHQLARRGKPSIRDLLNEAVVTRFPLIIPESESELHRIEEGLRGQGLALNVALRVGSLEAVKQYVARGLGVGVVSGICLTEDDPARVNAIEIPDEYGGSTTYGVVLRQDKYKSSALAGLLPLLGVEPK